MDIYASQEITGDDMIEGVDTAQIERSIERQAVDSGFGRGSGTVSWLYGTFYGKLYKVK